MLSSRKCLLGTDNHLVWKIEGKAIKLLMTFAIAHCSLVVIYSMFIADIWSGGGADSGGPQRKILSAPLDGGTHQTELSQAPHHSSWLYAPYPKNTDTFKDTQIVF
jgi:hypothetical protein